MIRILIADDLELERKALSALVQRNKSFSLIDVAIDGEDALDKIAKHRPDIVLLDLEMPRISGLEVAQIVHDEYPGTKVLVITGHEEESYVMRIVRSGAGGYLLKPTGRDELYTAINDVYKGERFFCPTASKVMVESLLNKRNQDLQQYAGARIPLTDSEKEILSYLTQGLTTEQISLRLSLRVTTVEKRFAELKKKLDIHDVVNLVQFAKDHGFLPGEKKER